MDTENKPYYTKEDIMSIYGVGINRAKQIIKEIKQMQKGKLALGRGKVLARELSAWQNRGRTA